MQITLATMMEPWVVLTCPTVVDKRHRTKRIGPNGRIIIMNASEIHADLSNSTMPDRRRFMYGLGAGLGSVALSWMLARDATQAQAATTPSRLLAPKAPHHPATAKNVIYLIMEGGPSQMDTFDPKPELARQDGKVYSRGDVKSVQVKGTRYFVKSPFSFSRYGASGREVSELFSNLGHCVDDMTIVRSLYTDSDNHPAALFQYNTGLPLQGNPSVGSWMVYGLGSENENLPAFVVLRDGKPFGGNASWANGYLPAVYQGTQFRSGPRPVLDLEPAEQMTRAEQIRNLELLKQLNVRHQQRHPRNTDLDARIASYELAFRMQSEIPEAVDVAGEDAATQALYGLDQKETKAFGERCLLARRLVERGVRFVQVWAGGWDSHDDVQGGHARAAKAVDKPLAGLLTDLKRRGLLDETLVVWGGEFGRTADTTEAAFNKQKPGRDHNPRAMTMWFAGGGVKRGGLIGETDEFGEHAAVDRFHMRDMHATLLHLMGLDQDELTFYHAGRFKRLTDTGGEIIWDLLA
jgi:hypothetical protein